jgi:uncharacterized protein
MLEAANTVTIIDHHKSAIEDLTGLETQYDNYFKDFDLEHSGAMLTWLHFFPDVTPPRLIQHIEDRDLWRFKFKDTRNVQAALFSYPYDFDIWDELMTTDPSKLALGGEAIERKHHKDIDELIAASVRRMNIGGITCQWQIFPIRYLLMRGIRWAKESLSQPAIWMAHKAEPLVCGLLLKAWMYRR